MVEHLARLFGGAGALPRFRARILASSFDTSQIGRALRALRALLLGRRAGQLSVLIDNEPILTHTGRPVMVHLAFLIALAPDRGVLAGVVTLPGSHVARQCRGTVIVSSATRVHVRPGLRALAPGVWVACRVRAAHVALRTGAARPVQHRRAERVQAAGPAQAARVYTAQVDARLVAGALGVTVTFRICGDGTDRERK